MWTSPANEKNNKNGPEGYKLQIAAVILDGSEHSGWRGEKMIFQKNLVRQKYFAIFSLMGGNCLCSAILFFSC